MKKKNDAAHTLRILSREGDTAVAWDPADTLSVTKAETTFTDFLGKGYAMFAVEAPGAKPEQVRTFDPKAFEILAVPAKQGG